MIDTDNLADRPAQLAERLAFDVTAFMRHEPGPARTVAGHGGDVSPEGRTLLEEIGLFAEGRIASPAIADVVMRTVPARLSDRVLALAATQGGGVAPVTATPTSGPAS